MDANNLIADLKAVYPYPEPERKEEFFQKLGEQGRVYRHSVVINNAEFLAGQFFYIQKRVWILSAAILLFIVGICYQKPGNYPFALTPLLVAGILLETKRSFRWKMAELEHTARFSLRSVLLARMFWVGAAETAGLFIVVWTVRHMLSYSLIRVFLYMTVPYLTASLSGALYERKRRTDNGWGSTIICLMSSAFFTAAPFLYSQLYEERLLVVWGTAFILLAGSLVVNILKWIHEMEEPVWSS